MQNWILSGIVRVVDSERMYTADEDDLRCRPFDYRVELVEQKTWFYKIWTSAAWLTRSHMNVVFYNLRKLQPTTGNIYTTTDSHFFQLVEMTHAEWTKTKANFDWWRRNS